MARALGLAALAGVAAVSLSRLWRWLRGPGYRDTAQVTRTRHLIVESYADEYVEAIEGDAWLEDVAERLEVQLVRDHDHPQWVGITPIRVRICAPSLMSRYAAITGLDPAVDCRPAGEWHGLAWPRARFCAVWMWERPLVSHEFAHLLGADETTARRIEWLVRRSHSVNRAEA